MKRTRKQRNKNGSFPNGFNLTLRPQNKGCIGKEGEEIQKWEEEDGMADSWLPVEGERIMYFDEGGMKVWRFETESGGNFLSGN